MQANTSFKLELQLDFHLKWNELVQEETKGNSIIAWAGQEHISFILLYF